MKNKCTPQKSLKECERGRNLCLITIECSEIMQTEKGLYYFEIGEE